MIDEDRMQSAAAIAEIDRRCGEHNAVRKAVSSQLPTGAQPNDDEAFLRRLTPTPQRYRRTTINEARRNLLKEGTP